MVSVMNDRKFLYSQDLSNRKTGQMVQLNAMRFLYSQDLSNRKTGAKTLC